MEKEIINVAMLQMSSVIGDIEANLEKVKTLSSKFLPKNTDILVLPEVWSVGWSCKDFIRSAQTLENSSACKLLSNIAKSYNIYIIGGSIIIKGDDNKYYNTCTVFDKNGNLITTYSKMHLYSYYGCNEGSYITEGKYPVMIEIYGVKFGLSICYDIRFPEIYRAYRKAGADLLINCAAWGLKKPIPWECMTRARACENQSYMVALTQSGYIENDEWNIGHSRIIDYKGETISEIKDQKEGAMTATLDFDLMYEFREKCKCICDIKEQYEVKYEKNI